MFENNSKSLTISCHVNLITETVKSVSLTKENKANAKLIVAAPETIQRLIKSNVYLHLLIENKCIKGVGTIQTVKEIIYANQQIIDKALNI